MDKDGQVEFLVLIDFMDLLDERVVGESSLEWLNDKVSSMLIRDEECCLEGISYKPYGVTPSGDIMLLVTGDLTRWWDEHVVIQDSP